MIEGAGGKGENNLDFPNTCFLLITKKLKNLHSSNFPP